MLKLIEQLIEQGADLNEQNERGETLLMQAAEKGDMGAVQKLLSFGVNLFLTDQKGQTALMKAVLARKEMVCSFLMGAMQGNIDQQDFQGETAYDMAHRLKLEDISNMILSLSQFKSPEDRLFLKVKSDILNGMDFNIEDEQGRSYLSYMIYQHYNKVAKFLIDHQVDVNHVCQRKFTPLMVAVLRENEEMVLYLLKKGAMIFPKNDKDQTALELAKSISASEKIIKMLEKAEEIELDLFKTGKILKVFGPEFERLHHELMQNATVTPLHEALAEMLNHPATYENGFNLKNKKGQTPLMLAVLIGDYQLVNWMLEAGVDIDFQGVGGETALGTALLMMDVPMVKLLLEKGADVHAENFEGETPLLRATKMMNTSLIKLLIENGANIYAVNQEGVSAFDFVLNTQEYEIAAFMKEIQEKAYHKKRIDFSVQKPVVEEKEDEDEAFASETQAVKEDPIFDAIKSRKVSLVRQLIEQGADIHLKDRFGQTPLFYAIERGQLKMVQLLVEQGADVNELNGAGNSPLMTAVIYERPKILSYLLEQGADIDLKGLNGNTALMVALDEGDNLMLRQLIKAKASIEVENDDHETPLIMALFTANQQALRLLIKQGADIWKENSEGVSAMQEAIENELFEDAALMKKVYEKRLGLSSVVALEKQLEKDMFLLKAIETGNKKAVQTALQKGGDVHLIDEAGEGVLFYCVRHKKTAAFKLLVEQGADVNMKNKDGQTVLDVILEASLDEKTQKKLAKILIENGLGLATMSQQTGQKLQALMNGVVMKQQVAKQAHKQKNKRERS
ncbi:MAG: ankyrin repeat domain-containing protein [Alphaproteobacteria bacterium]|nr:ankyrin repeat domain-containing protein [Alphaproteobacteria bacterium]